MVKKKKKKPLIVDPESANETDLQIHQNEMFAIQRKIERQREILTGHRDEMERMEKDQLVLTEEKDAEIKKLRQEVADARKLKVQRRNEKITFESDIKQDEIQFQTKLVEIERNKEERVNKLTNQVKDLREKVSNLKHFKANKKKLYDNIVKGYKTLEKSKEEHQIKINDLRRQRASGCQAVKQLVEQRIHLLQGELYKMRKEYATRAVPRLMERNQFFVDTVSHMNQKIKSCQAIKLKHHIKLEFVTNKKKEIKAEAEYLTKCYLDRCMRWNELEIVDRVEKRSRALTLQKSTKDDSLGISEDLPTHESPTGKDTTTVYVQLELQHQEFQLKAILNIIKKLAHEALAIDIVPAGSLAEEGKLTDREIMHRYKKRRQFAFDRRRDILLMILAAAARGLEFTMVDKTMEESQMSQEGTASSDKGDILPIETQPIDLNALSKRSSLTSSSWPRSPSSSYITPESGREQTVASIISELRELFGSAQLSGEEDTDNIIE